MLINNKILVLTVVEARKAKIQVLVDLVSSEGLLLGSYTVTSHGGRVRKLRELSRVSFIQTLL